MLKLYPHPHSVRFAPAGEHFNRGTRTQMRVVGDYAPRTHAALTKFAADHDLNLTYGEPSPKSLFATVVLDTSDGTAAQSYELKCRKSGVDLKASSDAGIYYGLQTLGQLISQVGPIIPCFTIKDAPDFPNRGVMLDISRCKVPTLSTLFALIDRLAHLKINQLQLYTEHTYAFVNHQRVWANASPFTAADILAIKSYCHARFIELVPNLNSFGHFERWLRYPEYHKYAECPHGFAHPVSNQQMPFGSTLYPDKQSLSLLEELYDEYLPLFDSTYFNVGGDEPWELGEGRSRTQCEKKGTTNVYIDFLNQIKRRTKSRKRTMMFWSDIVLRDPDCLNRLSKDMVALNWGYEGNHPFKTECQQMATAGVPYYVCPGTSSWNSLTGRTSNATKNLANAAESGLKNDAVGYLITDWGDHGHHQYQPVSYAGYLMGACHAWNHKGSKNTDFVDGLNRHFFDDPSQKSGEIFWRLGKVLELAPSPLRNATIFNRLIFWEMEHEPSAVQKITENQLQACTEEFSEIESEIAAMRPAKEAGLIRDEARNAIRLAQCGIERLKLFRGYKRNATETRESMLIAIGEHERLWLARNREGGLNESTGHLTRSLDTLN